MSRRIIVSDLHIDTWTDREIRRTGTTRENHFYDFLRRCENAGVSEFIINGDLLDLPPYEGQVVFDRANSIARRVLERLFEFGTKINITYVYGNHDIGISGFRCLGENNISQLKNISFCYPNYRVDYDNTTILVEHGHFYDPAILLYVNDLANFTYHRSKFEAYMWAMQRRNPLHPNKIPAPGLLKPIVVEEGENAYLAAKRQQEQLPDKNLWQTIKEILWKRGSLLLGHPKEWWWFHSAHKEMQDFIKTQREKQEILKPNLYQIYGHTHSADPRDPINIEGVNCNYINAGTWTDEVDNGWYLDIDKSGKVWLQDFVNEPEHIRRL